MVYAADLKSADLMSCGFNSHHPDQLTWEVSGDGKAGLLCWRDTVAMSTNRFAELNRQHHCLRLNLDHYEIEPYYQSKEVETVEGKEFYPMLLRFTKRGEKFIAVVPVTVKKVVKKVWLLTFTSYQYDYEAMENEVERIVREA